MRPDTEQLRFYNPDKGKERVVIIDGDSFEWWTEPKETSSHGGDGIFPRPEGSRSSVAEWITGNFRIDGFEPVKNPEPK